MYETVRGPLVWLAMILFIVGSLYKVISMLILVRREKTVLPTMSARHSLRSLLHWVIPYGSRSMRMHPFFTAVSYAFHLCLLVTPLFAMGHAVLWHESWGIRWWSLPATAADVMTLVVIFGGLIFFMRRLMSPEVRNVTSWKDHALLLLVVLPFVTGYIAHQQWLSYEATIVVHIISGALWLIAIPFTWLSHMLMFAFTRSFMGSEFGAVRNARDW